jgi:hypothetical protein
MKQFYSLLLVFLNTTLIVSLSTFTYGQVLPPRPVGNDITSNEVSTLINSGIDPRKFVTVLYKKRASDRPENTLAVWRWDEFSQHQKFKVLDKGGILNIYFDKNKLAHDTEFRGNISLSARVKSEAGERSIEVAPYSRVGEARQTFGTQSISPELTAQLLFNAIFAIKSTLQIYHYTSDLPITDTLSIKEIIGEVKTKNTMSSLVDTVEFEFTKLKKVLNYYYLFPEATNISNKLYNGNYNYGNLIMDLKSLIDELKDTDDYNRDLILKTKWPGASKLTKDLTTIIAYLDAFEKAGSDAKNVFIRLMGKDIITYEQLRADLKKLHPKINLITSNWNASYGQIKDGTFDSLISEMRRSLFDISSIGGSEFDQVLKVHYPEVDSSLLIDPEFERMKKLKGQPSIYKEVIDQLSRQAGIYLYSLLTYATVDLAKNDVKEGDILYLNLQWKNFRDQMVDSLKNKDEEAMEIGTYKIQKTGWSTNVSESFYLIERINEPNRVIDDNVSPSNFKGAAGVSLMRTFNYSEPNGKSNYRFLNWLQPSVGLNLSYVDFYTTKDLELGLGGQLGIFQNSIFLGCGLNLNGIRAGDKSPTYFMLGLSFTNLAAKFKSD